MSIASYRFHELVGVTSADLPTDVPAAFEQLYANCHLYKNTYKIYRNYMREADFSNMWAANSERQQVLNKVVHDLGGFSCRNMELSLIRDKKDFRDSIQWYLEDGWGVVANLDDGIGEPHAVGILPVEDRMSVRLVSNEVPSELLGKVTLHAVFKHLYQPDIDQLNRANRFIQANVLALVPEP